MCALLPKVAWIAPSLPPAGTLRAPVPAIPGPRHEFVRRELPQRRPAFGRIRAPQRETSGSDGGHVVTPFRR